MYLRYFQDIYHLALEESHCVYPFDHSHNLLTGYKYVYFLTDRN